MLDFPSRLGKSGRVNLQEIAGARVESSADRFEAISRIPLLAGLDLRDGADRQAGFLGENLQLHAPEFPPLPNVHKPFLTLHRISGSLNI